MGCGGGDALRLDKGIDWQRNGLSLGLGMAGVLSGSCGVWPSVLLLEGRLTS